MVFKCTNCNKEWWQKDCPRETKDGGSVIVCPSCHSKVRKEVGEVGKQILKTLPKDKTELSKQELESKLDYSETQIENSLRHLIDMGYIGTTPKWNYRLGSHGYEKRQEL